MQDENHFDYMIIGNGLAGLQLALALSEDAFFDSYNIALIDPSEKNINDKTWSFWEQENGKWDAIVKKTWDTALFHSNKTSLSIPLYPYVYKTIRSLDFYSWAKTKLASKSNFHVMVDSVQSISESMEVIGTKNTYTAEHIFDSRMPDDFYNVNLKHTRIHQHFKGLVVETGTKCFQPNSFTMMDYRHQYEDSTSFMYVLPLSETIALVEFTFFTPYTLEESIYDVAITSYLKNELKLEHYQILETEVGNIPMTDFQFWKYHTPNVTKIGTAGGWVKGSTGYSFKNTEKKVSKIIENIKQGKQPSNNLLKWKYKFYDAIFLMVLKNKNENGPWIFEQFYSKNNITTMFRFLDEETTFSEDLKIMKSLFSSAFIKAFFKVLLRF